MPSVQGVMLSVQADRLLGAFLDLVRIDSPSGEEAKAAAWCAEALAATGCTVRFDDAAAGTGSDTGNLIAELAGSLPGVLVLAAHLDTVMPGRGIEPVVEDGVVFSAGETVLGADDKAGLAVAIECVRCLSESGQPHPTVRCVFTVQEETGLKGAKALAPEDVAGSLCLVLDAAGPLGGVVIGAPTHYTFRARFTGRAAHAGVAPEEGISAILMASDAIARMRQSRIDERTTANVGTITGGVADNVVPASAEVTGECRSLDRSAVDRLQQEMDAAMHAAARRAQGEAHVDWRIEYEGFEVAEDAQAVRWVEAACADVGVEMRLLKTGGGSDANVFSKLGVPTLALACGMEGVHGTGEHIAVADMVALATLCIAAARQVAEG
ncbi:MAG: M20/M25/M40 family metallo-hydrolase [Coriobacteriia bacterium]|nr:M20/M25/M40 family metallo-hydrolase [Coriobacteriia bacterium]